MISEGASGACWLNGAAIYQVYPLSFLDTDGDSHGDLEGVIRGLDHIASMGVDALWLSPFFPSPLADFGYDITDHKAVAPRMGSLDTFDRLLAETHRRGLRLIIDLVCGHTSDRHVWFEESRRARRGGRSDWYVWSDPAPDGTAPNNWLSVFGGPAWTWEPRRRQYYLHHFLSGQPTLNLRNGGVMEALLDIARFWLDRGVDGFRLDAVDFLMRDPALRSNPPLSSTPVEIPAKPFGMQAHVFDAAHSDVRCVLERIRSVVAPYPGRALLGEVSSQPGAGARIDRYAKPGGLDCAYTLDLPKRPFGVQTFHAALTAAGDGAATCWSFSNHDVERAASRWRPAGADPERFAALLALLFCCLPGSLCLYQGDELGLPQADLAFEDLRDPFGTAFWPEFKGRDGSRTPMPWIRGATHGGFTSAASPWLPVPAVHRDLAIDHQETRPDSTLNRWRRCMALRRRYPDLRHGALGRVDEDGSVLSFTRGDSLVAVFNLSCDRAEHVLPPGRHVPLDIPLPGPAALIDGADAEGRRVTLPPLGALLARREG
ncbi:alpha-amylase [Skermanella stibiiresistens SB22]|uniref:Alpha-amylase n=1 Tax=Skermanella stibiiresistens SB22 TaxID=1385369 RepID=W9GTN3_9PROT|nr:alpha-amylase family glycosyl hydrolase [Skermanella stibiiresistens]EWY36046.1 alpha-amylase [Skermanella stibiiresistens SB22]